MDKTKEYIENAIRHRVTSTKEIHGDDYSVNVCVQYKKNKESEEFELTKNSSFALTEDAAKVDIVVVHRPTNQTCYKEIYNVIKQK